MAGETVLATLQITGKITVAAILALLAEHAVIARGQTRALVAQFTLMNA